MNDITCEEQYVAEWNQYNATTYCVLALTFVNLIVVRCYFSRGVRVTAEKYQNAAMATGFLGLIKIGAGIYLLFNYPVCPSGCRCVQIVTWYPYLAIFLGIVWILRAMAWINRAKSFTGLPVAQPVAQPVVGTAVGTAVVGNTAETGAYTVMK